MDEGTAESREARGPMTRPGSGARGAISRRAALGARAALAWQTRAPAQTPPGASGPTLSAAAALAAMAPPSAPDWPRVVKAGETTLSIYLPQLDSWNGNRLDAHAAVSVQTAGAKEPVFGVAFV